MINPELWIEKHADYLFAYARYKLPSKETAEDVVQETFLSALSAVDKFQGKSSERTWLVSILKRRIVDFYRKEAKRDEQNFSSYSLPFHEGDDMENHWLENRAPKDWSTDEKIQLDEFHQVLQICLSFLKPKQRLVFMMKILEQCSSDEVCEKAGISSENLWTIMHRARLQVRECIEKKWL